jgi:hypothetical protein
VAAHNTQDPRHGRATEILREIKEDLHGAAYSSDFILDEAVTLARVRTRDLRVARVVGRFFLPQAGELQLAVLLHVGEETVRRAWDLCRRHDAPLSFTDWTVVDQVRTLGIDLVASFDSKLDPWVTRLS